jgi:hypothetical protein
MQGCLYNALVLYFDAKCMCTYIHTCVLLIVQCSQQTLYVLSVVSDSVPEVRNVCSNGDQQSHQSSAIGACATSYTEVCRC